MVIAASMGNIPAEAELLLNCARTYIDPERAKRIRMLLREDINWNYLIRLASSHKMVPLLYWSLKSTCLELVPHAILQTLEDCFHANAQLNLLRTQELLKLLNLFDAQGIPAIPFKGPVMAAVAYGNLVLRQFGDLDILVGKRDFQKAKDLLISQGYQPYPELLLHWEWAFTHDNTKTSVDLHQAIISWEPPYASDFVHFWDCLEPVSLGGKTVLSFSPVDMLMTCCMQVAKDWRDGASFLAKLCDIAELLRIYQVDWNQLMERSRILRGERMLLFGLFLTNNLLGTPLPKEILQRIRVNPAIKSLTIPVSERLFCGIGRPLSALEWSLFKFRTMDRLLDRVRFIMVPTPYDIKLLPLPAFLYFLYYLLRPIRLVWKFVLKPFTDMAKKSAKS